MYKNLTHEELELLDEMLWSGAVRAMNVYLDQAPPATLRAVAGQRMWNELVGLSEMTRVLL